MSKVNQFKLSEMKSAGEKFAVVTAYDACFARVAEHAGIDVILVGDSLGMVLQGNDSTLPVSIEEMIYHTKSVRKGTSSALVIADMPFGSYNTPEDTMQNASLLMQAGAHMVKLEGGLWLLETIKLLTERGIPVCGHIGLTPQSVNVLGGFKVQGRDDADANRIISEAKALEQAGAGLIVVECVPSELGAALSEATSIPIIGIGAGPGTDAQVMVLHDILGISPRIPKFVRVFMNDADTIENALELYALSVKNGQFPGEEHCFS